ncbi:hypothetical protein ACFQ0F_08910 [Paraperlucidibaca wandonensis]|uniref:Uncharacterized protein n=1 Tax=Paraperlucidibaca wandonensis TaxID=1268273 RepID=A0ABW3HGB0_9GAMM
MKFHVKYEPCQSLRVLGEKFPIFQGNLFHYTDEQAAESISATGDLWLTRGDSFLDENEIRYGARLLYSAIERSTDGEMRRSFISTIDTLGEILRRHYLMSFTSNAENRHLAKNYGGTRIEFREDTWMLLRGGGYCLTPQGDGFRAQHFIDTLNVECCHVVYRADEQSYISDCAVSAMKEVYSMNQDSIEYALSIFSLREKLANCLALFKSPEFCAEEELRLFVYPRQGMTTSLPYDSRMSGDRRVFYMKARIPHLVRDCIVGVQKIV